MSGAARQAPPWLALIGIGEDGADGLSPRARALVAEAGLVAGGARHLALAEGLIRGRRLAWPRPIEAVFPELLAARAGGVAVLASGDPNWFGIGARLAAVVPAAETLCLPQPSSASLACARLGWALQEVAVVSACGRPLEAVVPALQRGARLLVLSAGAETPAQLAALLRARGFGPSGMVLLEALGGPRERVRRARADGFDLADPDPLNLVAVGCVAGPDAAPLSRAGLPDAAFAHDGQITRAEIRAMTLAALAPLQGEHLWDIGCGAGSIAVEWLLRHAEMRATGVERDPARAARARANALTLGVPRLRVVDGAAPAALAGLDPPDAVFVGGGAGEAVLDLCWEALRPGGRLVANAVTLETEALLIAACRARGGALTRIGMERLDRVGGRLGFRPAMTVTQWRAVR